MFYLHSLSFVDMADSNDSTAGSILELDDTSAKKTNELVVPSKVEGKTKEQKEMEVVVMPRKNSIKYKDRIPSYKEEYKKKKEIQKTCSPEKSENPAPLLDNNPPHYSNIISMISKSLDSLKKRLSIEEFPGAVNNQNNIRESKLSLNNIPGPDDDLKSPGLYFF